MVSFSRLWNNVDCAGVGSEAGFVFVLTADYTVYAFFYFCVLPKIQTDVRGVVVGKMCSNSIRN